MGRGRRRQGHNPSANDAGGEDAKPENKCRYPDEKQPPKWWQASDFWTAFGTIVIAAFTIILAVVGGFQYDATITADKTQRMNERAYVMPNPDEAIEVLSQGERDGKGELQWRISPVWTNSGNTPAPQAVLYTTSQTYWNQPSGGVTVSGPNVYSPVDTPDFQKIAPVILFFGPRESKRGGTILLPASQMESLSNSNSPMTLIFLAIYKDTFGDEHDTLVCRSAEFPQIDYKSGKNLGPIKGVDRDCPVYNCTDDGCSDYRLESWWPKSSFAN